jgi:hypothetical protein
MSGFQNLSIRSKVMAAFGTVLAVTVLLVVFSINRLSIVNDGAVTVSDNYLVSASSLSQIGENAVRYRQLQAYVVMSADAATKATALQSMATAKAEEDKGWATYSTVIDPGYERGIAERFHSELADYFAMNDKLVGLANAGKTAEASAYYTGEMHVLFDKFFADLQADHSYNLRMGQKVTQDIAQDEATSVVWGMPGAVAQAGICSAILPLPKISGHLASLFERAAA